MAWLGGCLNQNVFFHLYEYFNAQGQRIESVIVSDCDDPDYDASLDGHSLEDKLADAVTNNRFGRPMSDGPSAVETPMREAVLSLSAIVTHVLDGRFSVEKARSISSVAVNRLTPLQVAAVLSEVESVVDSDTARAVRAVFGSPRVA